MVPVDFEQRLKSLENEVQALRKSKSYAKSLNILLLVALLASPIFAASIMNGNFGIGTTSPSAELHVRSTDSNDMFLVEDSGAGDTTPFRIDASGNVDIGAALNSVAPSGDAHDAHLTSGKLAFENTSPQNYIHFNGICYGGGSAPCPNTPASIFFDFFSDGFRDIGFNIGGSLNFGTMNASGTPSSWSEVTRLTNAGTFVMLGCVNSGDQIGGRCLSDEKYATNIKPLQGSLDKILALQPRVFTWRENIHENDENAEGQGIGLFAAEVARVLPAMVEIDKQGRRRIKYSIRLQMHLLQAIKELAQKTESLQQEVVSLQHRQQPL